MSTQNRHGALILAALAVLPDLERFNRTQGPGPDKRLDALRDELPEIPGGYRLAYADDARFQLLAPNGALVIGTNESVPATAQVDGWTCDEDGTLRPEYEGTTDIAWNGQESVGDEVVDEDGQVWHEGDCIRVVETE